MNCSLSSSLADALADIEVSTDLLRAKVGDRVVVVDEPGRMIAALSAALYEELHVGRQFPGWDAGPVRDLEFEQELARATPHRQRVADVPLVRDEGDRVLVQRDGVLVWYPGSRVATPAPGPGRVALAVEAVRPALSPGYLLVEGTVGRPVRGPLLRIYLHIAEAACAPGLWRAGVAALEETGIRYQAKVTSSREMYPRRDAIVIYLEGGAEPGAVHRVLDAVRSTDGLADATSVFAHQVADGVALAWEPNDDRPGMRGTSFGEHRAKAVARGLVHHVRDGADASAVEAVRIALRAAGIDPACPAMNTDSAALPV